MLILKSLSIVESMDALKALPEGKLLINTINAHSYNTAQKDRLFAEALKKGDALIPDGASIVKACKWLNAQSKPKERIAGWDLFVMEMERLNARGGTCFFMGSSEKVLELIKKRAALEYPRIRIETYSPPYKPEFSPEENKAIIDAINRAGTVKRAPLEWQKHSLEWLYRLLKEPKRMWKRYIIGNSLFLLNVMKERKKGK